MQWCCTSTCRLDHVNLACRIFLHVTSWAKWPPQTPPWWKLEMIARIQFSQHVVYFTNKVKETSFKSKQKDQMRLKWFSLIQAWVYASILKYFRNINEFIKSFPISAINSRKLVCLLRTPTYIQTLHKNAPFLNMPIWKHFFPNMHQDDPLLTGDIMNLFLTWYKMIFH